MNKSDNQDKTILKIIIGDLEVLSKKCSRDINLEHWGTSELFREEYNRILENLKKVQPDIVDGIVTIPRKKYLDIDNDEFGRLCDVDAATSRLLVRLRSFREPEIEEDLIPSLEKIFSHFHSITKQLRDRRENRTTLDVRDEYDVQDLLHSLLLLFFKDIRPEEWTPSYAGGSSRMDFLLKEYQAVVEVKKTRDNLRDKQIGSQLIEDIARYKEHPDCKTLVCFVYDPDGYIANYTGLENDLRKQSNENIDVRLYIYPK